MSTLKLRLTFLALAVGGALLLLPATGQAAQVFGSRLKGAANEATPNVGCQGTVDVPCTLVSAIEPSEPEGTPTDSGAPSDGVITKFRIRATAEAPTQATFRVADITVAPGGDTATATTTGAGLTVTLAKSPEGEAPIQEFSGSIPVKKGQHLAVDVTDALVVHASNSDEFTYAFDPPLIAGRGPQESKAVTEELFLQATIEPDADGDGFGDETQDKCPSQKSTQGACDNTPPAVTGLKVSGLTISYNLSEAATVNFALAKKTVGRKVGGKCVRKTRRNSARKHCALFKTIRRDLDGPGKRGANQVALPKLKPGVYRLTMTARDAFGNQTVKTTTFKVKQKKKKRR